MPRPLSRKTPIISIALNSEQHFSNPSHECVHNYRFYGQSSKAIASQPDMMRTIDLRTHDDDEETLNYEYYRNSRLSDITEEERVSMAKNEADVDAISVSNTPHLCEVEVEVNKERPGFWRRLHVIFTFPCGRDMKCSEEGHSVRVNAGFKKFGVDKIWAAFF